MSWNLPGAPWLIAHRSMLEINKPKKITLNNQDYVLWQNRKFEVFALENVCPHLQAPLSDGWICEQRDTITCPFHALEFDGKGRLYREGKLDSQPIAKPLDITIIDDFIWTYGGFEPKTSIPDLIHKIAKEYEFLGVAVEKSIHSDLLSNLLISYDFNHQNGTHRRLFRIKENRVSNFVENGYYAKLNQEFIRDENTLGELLQNPALLTMPKVFKNRLEYVFPSTTAFFGESSIGTFVEVHFLYPETENRTRTFVLGFAKLKYPMFKKLVRGSFMKAIALVVEQDSRCVESLYPRQKPNIRLSKEEIMFYAERLYHQW